MLGRVEAVGARRSGIAVCAVKISQVQPLSMVYHAASEGRRLFYGSTSQKKWTCLKIIGRELKQIFHYNYKARGSSTTVHVGSAQ